MAKCPHCKCEEETQEHFFKCKQDDPKRGEKDWGGRETKMVTEKYLDSQNAFVGLTEVVHRVLQLAALLDWNKCTKVKIEWEYQCWKVWCEAQIDQEEGSQILPETQQQRMQMEQPVAMAGDGLQADGIPERVQTIRGCEAKFKRWCTD
ncbi:hypothetical protein EV182_002323 [Spiromyces aspiralis]|uniref:Uncharacterized protein n=1 Tax=Spiromyces aspiralis TaxID=68401 RepID=A0ACC1HHW5_9FUNG|nr:hypothetical protein EV182_002323 [Spiromyces aspiralis]